ncbi:MAG: glycosyl transferase [Saprospirales bacterium]|nr:glycosyl transferase [Saprospirales bacterium]
METLFTWWTISSLILAAGYVAIIAIYTFGWKRLPVWEPPAAYLPSVKCTVIIPARNEAPNLPECLASIAGQSYPASLTQVIVVDDHSEDETLDIARKFADRYPHFEVLELKAHLPEGKKVNSFKKEAIDLGVRAADGELIVTTDADCVLPPDWLMLMCSFYEVKKPVFIAAPVGFHREQSLFERFQSLDFFGMMCGTAAGIRLGIKNMANGANLAYSKAAYQAVNGFRGIDHLATGDDILLMQKIAASNPGKTAFLKNEKATARTLAKPTVREFISQRVRWASKSTDYKEWLVTFILGWVFFYCVFILTTPILFLFVGTKALVLFVFLLSVKTVTDYFYLGMMAKFFRREELMMSYFPAQLIHILYIVTVGVLGNLVKRYDWKGRTVR